MKLFLSCSSVESQRGKIKLLDGLYKVIVGGDLYILRGVTYTSFLLHLFFYLCHKGIESPNVTNGGSYQFMKARFFHFNLRFTRVTSFNFPFSNCYCIGRHIFSGFSDCLRPSDGSFFTYSLELTLVIRMKCDPASQNHQKVARHGFLVKGRF